MILKRLALATSAVAGGACLGVWALPKLQKDEVGICIHLCCSTNYHEGWQTL